LMPSPLRLSRAKSAPTPTSGAGPMPRSASKVTRPSWMPRWPRVPVSVRRVLLLLGVVAAVVGLPGPAQAAVSPAAAAVSARAPATAVHAGAPEARAQMAQPTELARAAGVSQPAGPVGVTGRVGPAAPGGVCQVPGIGDIGGLLGFCNAGSSGLIGA